MKGAGVDQIGQASRPGPKRLLVAAEAGVNRLYQFQEGHVPSCTIVIMARAAFESVRAA